LSSVWPLRRHGYEHLTQINLIVELHLYQIKYSNYGYIINIPMHVIYLLLHYYLMGYEGGRGNQRANV
jgi:hypothetical protein